MLQKEFEERIGRSVTKQEYVEANAMFMSAGDIDKDTFCREWLMIGSSALVTGLFETAYQNGQKVQKLELLRKEAVEIFHDAADAMLEIVQGLVAGEKAEHTAKEEEAAEQLIRKACWLVGDKEVVRRKIKMGMALTEKDKDYINEHLK